MDSDQKTFLACATLAVLFFLIMTAAFVYTSALAHSCRLHGFSAGYDSAHIAQICKG